MTFCQICGNTLQRTHEGDCLGFLCCRNGHKESDEYTIEFQEAHKQREISKLRDATTFPDIETMEVYEVVHPYVERQREDGIGIHDNNASREFYGWIKKELCNNYEHDDFRYVTGTKLRSRGLIFVRADLAGEIEDQIERFILSDGLHFTLKQIAMTLEEKHVLVERLKEEFKVD